MNASCQSTSLILGCGGRNPGIRPVAAASDTGAIGALLAMPASVYAIDIDPVRSLAACATRAGTIHLLRFGAAAESEEPEKVAHLLHGRPVLSVCLTAEGGMVSADDSGQVLYWREEHESAPERWRTNGPVICSLYAEGGPVVTGLSAAGQITFWDARTGRSTAQLVGPPPLTPVGLARLAGWTSGEQVMAVYPAQDGQLVVIRSDPPLIRVCHAHESRWYAAFQLEDSLITVGYDDGTAKLWRWLDDRPVCHDEITAFPGVIDAALMPQADFPSGVAVFGTGKAVVFTITPQGLQLHDVIPGDAYRVVAGPCERLRRQASALQAEHRAEELQQQVATSIERGEEHVLDEALVELDRLGYRARSLELQAQRAARGDDQIAELQTLHQLAIEWINNEQLDTQGWSQRYLDLLFQFGQVELAANVLDQLERIRPGLSRTLDGEAIRRAVDAITAGRTLIHAFPNEPDHIPKAIRAARILRSAPKGLWELHRSPAVLLPGIELPPEQLAESLRVSAEEGPEQLVSAVAQPVLWIHGRSCEQAVSVLLPVSSHSKADSVRIALCPAMQPAGTVLTRSILLDPVANGRERSEEEIVHLAGQLQDESGRATLLGPINDRVFTTLRRMRSIALASATSPLGGLA